MAWGTPASRGTANTRTTGTTVSVSPSANLTVGEIVFALCISDNVTTSDTESTDHAVTDTNANSWTKIRELTDDTGTAAGSGITMSLHYTKVTTQIGTGDSVTLTMPSTDAKAIAIATVSGGTPGVTESTAAIGTNTATLSSLSNGVEYLLIGFGGIERPTATSYTQDADYTDLVMDFGTSGTPSSSNVQGNSGYRISSALTTDTYAVTFGLTGNQGIILAALTETAAASGGGLQLVGGAGLVGANG
jgi:hypothetical protein